MIYLIHKWLRIKTLIIYVRLDNTNTNKHLYFLLWLVSMTKWSQDVTAPQVQPGAWGTQGTQEPWEHGAHRGHGGKGESGMWGAQGARRALLSHRGRPVWKGMQLGCTLPPGKLCVAQPKQWSHDSTQLTRPPSRAPVQIVMPTQRGHDTQCSQICRRAMPGGRGCVCPQWRTSSADCHRTDFLQ